MADGCSAEIAVTGNDGLVGIALFKGGESTLSRAVVHSADYGYRLKAALVPLNGQGDLYVRYRTKRVSWSVYSGESDSLRFQARF